MITNGVLTPKQRLFCEKYIETKNATESAKFAGYSKKTAHRIGAENLHKPAIKAYIDNVLNEELKNVIASRNEVLELLTRVIRREEMEEHFWEGKTFKTKANVANAIKAGIELLNRYDIVEDKKTEAIKIIIDRGED